MPTSISDAHLQIALSLYRRRQRGDVSRLAIDAGIIRLEIEGRPKRIASRQAARPRSSTAHTANGGSAQASALVAPLKWQPSDAPSL